MAVRTRVTRHFLYSIDMLCQNMYKWCYFLPDLCEISTSYMLWPLFITLFHNKFLWCFFILNSWKISTRSSLHLTWHDSFFSLFHSHFSWYSFPISLSRYFYNGTHLIPHCAIVFIRSFCNGFLSHFVLPVTQKTFTLKLFQPYTTCNVYFVTIFREFFLPDSGRFLHQNTLVAPHNTV